MRGREWGGRSGQEGVGGGRDGERNQSMETLRIDPKEKRIQCPSG